MELYLQYSILEECILMKRIQNTLTFLCCSKRMVSNLDFI
nr:MAG TPA: hypothetical protein [Bacteriophage sp.]